MVGRHLSPAIAPSVTAAAQPRSSPHTRASSHSLSRRRHRQQQDLRAAEDCNVGSPPRPLNPSFPQRTRAGVPPRHSAGRPCFRSPMSISASRDAAPIRRIGRRFRGARESSSQTTAGLSCRPGAGGSTAPAAASASDSIITTTVARSWAQLQLAPYLAAGTNLVRAVFLDPRARDMYQDWESYSARAVAHLRPHVGLDVDDPT
jgi:hypothetical protein